MNSLSEDMQNKQICILFIIFSEFSVKINVAFNGKPFPAKISAHLLENPKEIKYFYDN